MLCDSMYPVLPKQSAVNGSAPTNEATAAVCMRRSRGTLLIVVQQSRLGAPDTSEVLQLIFSLASAMFLSADVPETSKVADVASFVTKLTDVAILRCRTSPLQRERVVLRMDDIRGVRMDDIRGSCLWRHQLRNSLGPGAQLHEQVPA